MKKNSLLFGLLAVVVLSLGMAGSVQKAIAADKLTYSCSNQVFKAFEEDRIDAFTKETGIGVDVQRGSSNACVYRLMNGYSDIASSARSLSKMHEEYGFSQVAFCKDPIAVIAKKGCGVDSLTEEQIRDIFSGVITNWESVGGKRMTISVVVPGEDTAANKNFRRLIMKQDEIQYDIATFDSTSVLEVVNMMPCGTISFISQGAATHYGDIQAIRVDGKLPTDKGYPYFQTLYYITRGEAKGSVKDFIDFSFTPKGQDLIRKNGMIPLARE